jgi:uncharacterized protein (TIGR02246 family)
MGEKSRDRIAIHELYAEYVFSFDGDDPDRFAQCFTEDALFEVASVGNFDGRAAIRGLVSAAIERGANRSFHLVSSIKVLTLDSEQGIATAAARFMAGQGDGSLSWGTYTDSVKREADGQWRFSEHRVRHSRLPGRSVSVDRA